MQQEFNIGKLADEYRIGDKIDVVGTLEINTFNGVDKFTNKYKRYNEIYINF